MNNFFNSLSKGVLATLAIGAGIFFIVVSDPPHTICDTEVETLKQAQANVLFVSPERAKLSRGQAVSTFRERFADCQGTNRPGGCYELFQQTQQLIRDLKKSSEECRQEVANISEVQTGIWDVLDLLVRIAWGDKGPASYADKNGWLEPADLGLYCQIKSLVPEFYKKERWVSFRERMLKELPGASAMTREQAWERLLLSTNCGPYM